MEILFAIFATVWLLLALSYKLAYYMIMAGLLFIGMLFILPFAVLAILV